jgi:hypothetical protein
MVVVVVVVVVGETLLEEVVGIRAGIVLLSG